jgi:hypothetical protein
MGKGRREQTECRQNRRGDDLHGQGFLGDKRPWPRGFFAKTQTSIFSAGIKRDTEKPGTAKKRKSSG